MNFINYLELKQLGYNCSQRTDEVYNGLKCMKSDVHAKFDHNERTATCPVYACKFCPKQEFGHYLAVANEDGRIVIHNTLFSQIETQRLSTFQGHNNAIFDITWANDGMKVLTASGDHGIVLWDVGESEFKSICHFHGHARSAKTLAVHPDNDYLYCSGGRDGRILIWDTRVKCYQDSLNIHPDVTLHDAHYKKMPRFKRANGTYVRSLIGDLLYDNTITGLVFQDDKTFISCSANDGLIKVWDVRRTYTTYGSSRLPQPLHSLPYPNKTGRNGFTRLALSPCGTRLYANCMDDSIYCYDVCSYSKTPMKTFKGHIMSSFYIRNSVSPDGRYIASGSGNESAFIWSVEKPEIPVTRLISHHAEVTCVDWCRVGETKMVTSSDDGTYRIWRIKTRECASDCDPDLEGEAEQCSNDTKKWNFRNAHKRKLYFSSHFKKAPKFESKQIENIDPNISPIKDNNYDVSPEIVQKAKKIRLDVTPLKDSTSSLTANLPNFVIDGTSPHNHRCNINLEPQEDWLTQLRKTTPQGKTSPLALARAKRRSTRSPSAKGSLLKYFKKSSRAQCDTLLETCLENDITELDKSDLLS